MSLLDRIAECNAHDLAGFIPFEVEGTRVGWVRPAFARRLERFAETFEVTEAAVRLAAGLDGYAARTAAVEGALRALAAEGVIGPWRDERYAVGTALTGPHFLEMDRSAVSFFGVRAYGVHLNGYVRGEDGLSMWIGRRSLDKPTYPGELDNTVAGGQPAGVGLRANLIKEAAEEAGIPRALAEEALAVGAISYCQETADGLKPDVMYCYDLELPADFVPECHDGEIAEFFLWPAARVIETVAETTEFKFNCNLVCIDFFIRHGLLDPERPDYVEIVRGLRR